MYRMDEAIIVLAELKAALNRQWGSQEFTDYRQSALKHIAQNF